jgi:hypothetical protein
MGSAMAAHRDALAHKKLHKLIREVVAVVGQQVVSLRIEARLQILQEVVNDLVWQLSHPENGVECDDL